MGVEGSLPTITRVSASRSSFASNASSARNVSRPSASAPRTAVSGKPSASAISSPLMRWMCCTSESACCFTRWARWCGASNFSGKRLAASANTAYSTAERCSCARSLRTSSASMMANASSTSLLTFSARIAVSTRYIMLIIFCLGGMLPEAMCGAVFRGKHGGCLRTKNARWPRA